MFASDTFEKNKVPVLNNVPLEFKSHCQSLMAHRQTNNIRKCAMYKYRWSPYLCKISSGSYRKYYSKPLYGRDPDRPSRLTESS